MELAKPKVVFTNLDLVKTVVEAKVRAGGEA